MKYWETEDSLPLPWPEVAAGYWWRYPNPHSNHVLTVDTLETRLEGDQLRTGLGEVITQLHNLQLTRDTQTVCARRTMAEVIQADIQTYPQDEKTYRLVAVVLLVTDSQEENTETVISGSVDLHLETRTLRLEQARLKTDRQSLVFGCLQQYSTGEIVFCLTVELKIMCVKM